LNISTEELEGMTNLSSGEWWIAHRPPDVLANLPQDSLPLE
jgi:hypothetical protein